MKLVKRVLVVTLIAAAVVVLTAPIIARSGYAITNDSHLPNFEEFDVYQNVPDLGLIGAAAHEVTQQAVAAATEAHVYKQIP
jgi:hypothetical protein